MPAASSASLMNSPRPWIPLQYQRSYAISFSRCAGLYRERVDALRKQIGERAVHQSLAFNAREAGEGCALDRDGEMRFAGAVVAHMGPMLGAVVADMELRRGERGSETGGDETGERAGGEVGHRDYIGRLFERVAWPAVNPRRIVQMPVSTVAWRRRAVCAPNPAAPSRASSARRRWRARASRPTARRSSAGCASIMSAPSIR